jgi:hypothetical protein
MPEQTTNNQIGQTPRPVNKGHINYGCVVQKNGIKDHPVPEKGHINYGCVVQ